VKVVIDTNIIIAIINKTSPYRWVFECLIDGRLILCVSTDILFEYREILAAKTNAEVADNFIAFLMMSPFIERVEIYYSFNLIHTDTSDNKFADCAIAANANFLILNDRHFNVLKTIDFPKLELLSLKEFELLRTQL
jgi:putative PIN family toxin of toxin-antitoxin system